MEMRHKIITTHNTEDDIGKKHQLLHLQIQKTTACMRSRAAPGKLHHNEGRMPTFWLSSTISRWHASGEARAEKRRKLYSLSQPLKSTCGGYLLGSNIDLAGSPATKLDDLTERTPRS